MNLSYYLKNLIFGTFSMGCMLYLSRVMDAPGIFITQILSVISAFLFPYARYFIESLALKRTDKKYWQTGMFEDGVAKSYLMTLYIVFCFILSLPLGISGLIYDHIKKR